MKELTKTRVDKFIENYNTAKKAFFWDGNLAPCTYAIARLDSEKEVSVEELKAIKKQIKKESKGIFNISVTSARHLVAAVMTESDNPGETLARINDYFKKLRKITTGADFDAAAAALISRYTKAKDADALIEKVREVFKGLKEEHPILTGYDDIINCVLMAQTEKSAEELVSESEKNFGNLKGEFFSKNNVQSLACILTVFDGESEDKCFRSVNTYNKLKENKIRLSGYSLACAGTFSQLVKDEDFDAVVSEIEEVSEVLKKVSGLGNFSAGKTFRKLISTAIVLSGFAEESKTQTGATINSIVSTILAQQMALVACTCATAAAAASH